MKLCPNCFQSVDMKHGVCALCGYNGAVQRDQRALPVGIRLKGRYIIGRVLGMGGFGITYIALDAGTGIRMAVKEYFPAEWVMRVPENIQIVPNSRNMDALYRHGQEVFMNEAQVLRGLRNVPNIINVSDFFMENGTSYIVMDFLDGFTLNNYLKRTGKKRMEYPSAIEIVRVVGMALHQVHKQMLLHRDVGPDNIMIKKNRDIFLIDFGATRMYALNSPKSMSVLVKPGFAPIEQYSRAGNQGPWTDIYALAATFYYLVTGVKPPDAPDRIAGMQVKPMEELVSGIPDYISRATSHALEENWRKRPQSMRDFLSEMQLLQQAEDIPRTIWGWQGEDGTPENVETPKRPCVLLQVDNQRIRYYFMQDQTLCIGRAANRSNVLLEDKQVSGLHCKLWYDAIGKRFTVENYSSNLTYTSQRVLHKNESVILVRGEWLYIQTKSKRYIFYLEVE